MIRVGRGGIIRSVGGRYILGAALIAVPLLGGCVSAVEDGAALTAMKDAASATEAAQAAAGDKAETKAAGDEVAAAAKAGGEKAGVDVATMTSPAERIAAAHGDAGNGKPTGDEAAGKAVEAIAKRDSREALIATGTAAVAAFAGSSVLVSSQTDQAQTTSEKAEQPSMFASLYAQSKAKTPIRNTDLGKTRRVILPRGGSAMPADTAALPGVRSNASLFEIGQKASADYDADIIDEASGEEGVYQTASISGLARLAPNGLTVQRPDVQTTCFQPDLVSIIRAVETKFHAKVVVTSGYRSPSHNTRVNGAKRSMHLQCKAADILVPGADKFQVANYVRSLPNRGGVGTYCNTAAIHVDTGRQRDWNWACRRGPARDPRILLASQKVSSGGDGD